MRLAAIGEPDIGHGFQHDAPVSVGGYTRGADDAFLVDDPCVQINAATDRDEGAEVNRFVLRGGNSHDHIGHARIDQLDALTCCEHNLSTWRFDQAFIFHLFAEQPNAPTERGANLTFVHNFATIRTAGSHEVVTAREKICIGDIQRRRDHSSYVDASVLSKKHTMWINQPHSAVAAQSAENCRRIRSGDPVEYLARRMLLLKTHAILRANGKALPIENGIRAVGNGHLRTTSTDASAAVYNSWALRQLLRVDRLRQT